MSNDTYDAPRLQEIGRLHDLTMQDKNLGLSDGFTFQGQPIRNFSP